MDIHTEKKIEALKLRIINSFSREFDLITGVVRTDSVTIYAHVKAMILSTDGNNTTTVNSINISDDTLN